MKTITLSEYAKKIGYKKKPETLEEIQKFAQNELDWSIFDYPISEINHVLNDVHDNNEDEIIFVITEYGIRICEI